MLRAPCRMEHPRLKKKKYRKRLNAFLRYETDGKFNLPHVNSGIVASRSTRIFLEKKKKSLEITSLLQTHKIIYSAPYGQLKEKFEE